MFTKKDANKEANKLLLNLSQQLLQEYTVQEICLILAEMPNMITYMTTKFAIMCAEDRIKFNSIGHNEPLNVLDLNL